MKVDIVRAWKDAEYRNTLSAEELAFAGNPVDAVLLSDGSAGEDGLASRATDYCYGCRTRITQLAYPYRRCCC